MARLGVRITGHFDMLFSKTTIYIRQYLIRFSWKNPDYTFMTYQKGPDICLWKSKLTKK